MQDCIVALLYGHKSVPRLDPSMSWIMFCLCMWTCGQRYPLQIVLQEIGVIVVVGDRCSEALLMVPNWALDYHFDCASCILQGGVLASQGSLFAFSANGAELLLKQVSRIGTRISLNVGLVYQKILALQLVSAE
jgi:hypothetical protein